MTISTPKQAIDKALAQDHNVVGTCQMTVRTWFNAPSAGDQNGDGDADAMDGWNLEPEKAKHRGDRNPPPGVPLTFSGGSHGYGHRAMSLAHAGRIRSTDMLNNRYAPGHTSTVSAPTSSAAIAVIEQQMGIHYEGWSETIDGQKIPGLKTPGTRPTTKPPVKKTSRGVRVDDALESTKIAARKVSAAAKGGKTQPRAEHLARAQKHLDNAVKSLEKVPLIK